MRLLALTLKNVRQHGISLAGATVLTSACLFVGWVMVFAENLPSLMSGATGLLYYLGPAFILFLNERIVVVDHRDGTQEFLSALPLSAVLRMGVPFFFGLAVVLAVSTGLLTASAVVATRREGVPLLWFFQLNLQVGAYLLAWHALAFGVAHTGRWRWLVWWTTLVLVSSLDGTWIDRPLRTVLWHAVMADPIEHSRSLPPWDAFPIAAAWTLLGVSLAAFLGTWRGGALPARWFAPSDSRQRAALVLGAVMVAGSAPMIEALAPDRDRWEVLDRIPSKHADVRVAGASLQAVGRDVAALLDQATEVLGVQAWPTVVLHPAKRGTHRHVRRASTSDVALVLQVDPDGPSSMLVRSIVTEVLLRQTGELSGRVQNVDWLVRGTAGWLAPSPVLHDRLALVEDLDAAFQQVVQRHGPDAAEALAVARLQALEDRDGRDAVVAILGPLLATPRGSSFFSWLSLRATSPGLELPALTPLEPRTDWPLLPPLALEADGEVLVAKLEWPAPRDTVLRKTQVDPLELTARPQSIWRVEDVTHRTNINVGFNPTQPASAELAIFVPEIEGWVHSPRADW